MVRSSVSARARRTGRTRGLIGCAAAAAIISAVVFAEAADIGAITSSASLSDPTHPTPSPTNHTLTPAPKPTSTTPTPPLTTPIALELPDVASNFNASSELIAAWGTGAIPESSRPDNVGAFRFICNVSHEAYDDPIVYPGQPGKSHLHEFFGNTGANAYSTYASLRSSGDSTCGNRLNRSAYWMPAMLNGKGKVVRPDYVSVYYKRYPASSPECTRQGTKCVDLPRGLRFVFGYNMLNRTAAPTGDVYFNCDGPSATPGNYPDIVVAASNCPMGNRLGAIIEAPDCWDGVNLDSADHRSHIAYSIYKDTTYPRCPSTHPFVIPTFTMGVWYTTDADLDRSGTWDASRSTWSLSSDSMPGMAKMKPGTSFHADWFGAWDENVMQMWTDNCINKLLNCFGGDLGNGKQLKQFSGFTWTASPRLVNPPPA